MLPDDHLQPTTNSLDQVGRTASSLWTNQNPPSYVRIGSRPNTALCKCLICSAHLIVQIRGTGIAKPRCCGEQHENVYLRSTAFLNYHWPISHSIELQKEADSSNRNWNILPCPSFSTQSLVKADNQPSENQRRLPILTRLLEVWRNLH